MDALKNFMSTMTGTIMEQVSEWVKKAVETASSARPLPRFEYVLITCCEPFYRHAPMVSHRHGEEMREAPHADRNGRSWGERRDRSIVTDALHNSRPSHGRQARSTTALTLYVNRLVLGTGADTTECRELRKALHELADKGQIDRFLKGGPCFLREEREPAQPEPQDEKCSTELVATIAGGYMEGIARPSFEGPSRFSQLNKAAKLQCPLCVRWRRRPMLHLPAQ
ncbi:hypothetical protein Cgig2_018917 [Carnegiea gigantea]|uniref:Uncharacterized protein n=1 Tax=Carnegiea gigantea TaxID=171969 RepID=A0A9Q1GS78_9CARY|nr:hypothetical protein Cgig2_018917 [Carnegiea gigantea]